MGGQADRQAGRRGVQPRVPVKVSVLKRKRKRQSGAERSRAELRCSDPCGTISCDSRTVDLSLPQTMRCGGTVRASRAEQSRAEQSASEATAGQARLPFNPSPES